MKKFSFLFLVAIPLLAFVFVVHAQGTASVVSGHVSAGGSTIVQPSPSFSGGFVQFNNLSVQSVSGTNPPAEIMATADIPPFVGAAGAAASSARPMVGCVRFESQKALSGQNFPCPGTDQYRIKIDTSTQLYLQDRTAATLSDFASGDQINVFGSYNEDGSVQAYLVRDLSRPVASQVIQLNNVTVASISSTSIVVTQGNGYPCYGFMRSGSIKAPIACPLGVSSTNAATKNISVPVALAPSWMMLRKYVVVLNPQTIILDSNRTRLTAADLKIGDSLNVYGSTSDNGQTLNADIVRDLSIPAAASTYSGQVTQINGDGSFVIKTGDGQTITVASALQVGATVRVTGLLDRTNNVLSGVTSLFFGADVISPPFIMAPASAHAQSSPMTLPR